MAQKSLQALVQLVEFDQYINTINSDIKQLQNLVQTYHQKRQALKYQILQATDSLQQLQKQMREIEHTISGLDNQEKEKKELLKELSQKKSIDALRREIQLLKQEQYQQEEALLHVWNKLEVANKDHELLQMQLQQEDDALAQNMQECEQKIQAFYQNLDKAYLQRSVKEKDVPGDWLEKYVRMREQVQDPVVPLIESGCSSCFFSVSAQESLSIKRGALIACKGCYRLLYITETETI